MAQQAGHRSRFQRYSFEPNVSRFSCAAVKDRHDCRSESTFQKSPDLAAAQRRQLQAPVGPW